KVDFKGNTTEVERRLAKDYKQVIDWTILNGITTPSAIENAADPLLETEKFTTVGTFDALRRPVTITFPDNSIAVPKYNESNFLDSLQVKIRGQGSFLTFLDSQDYNARGQRLSAKYGNSAITKYFYDPKTFRLINLVTKP